MMLAVLNAVKCLMGETDLLGKFCVGKLPPCLPQEFRQLLVQIASHDRTVAKTA